MPELFLNGKHMMVRRDHRLIVLWDGQEVPGVVKVLQTDTRPGPVLPSRRERTVLEGGVPGPETCFHVVIKRRVLDAAFREWSRSAHDPTAPGDRLRKDIDIRVVDERGEIILSYVLIGCTPSEQSSMPSLLAGEGMGMEEITMESRGLVVGDIG